MENQASQLSNTIMNALVRKYNTLLDCPVQFAGDYGEQKIQHFIDYIEAYKSGKHIPDEQALQELGYLLTDHAHTWWLRRKCHFTTWSEAITALQNHYAKQRPAYLIFKEIFEHPFEAYTTETDFIDDKFELLTELSDPKFSERNILYMLLALLPSDIQQQLSYALISNLLQLKEQLIKLKYSQPITNAHSFQSIVIKNEVKDDDEEMMIDRNQCDSLETNPNRLNLNHEDTINLMTQVQREENEEPQEEFSSTQDLLMKELTTGEHDERDIMNIIKSIIDEPDTYPEFLESLKKQNNDNEPTQSSTNQTAETLNTETQIPRKKRLRCSYCRKCGHNTQSCYSRSATMKSFLSKLLLFKDYVDDEKEVEEAVNSNTDVNESKAANICTNSVSTEAQEMVTSTSIPVVNLNIASTTVSSTHTTTTKAKISKCSQNSKDTTEVISAVTKSTLSPSIAKVIEPISSTHSTTTKASRKTSRFSPNSKDITAVISAVTTSALSTSALTSIAKVIQPISLTHVTKTKGKTSRFSQNSKDITASLSAVSTSSSLSTSKVIEPIKVTYANKEMSEKQRNVKDPASPKCHQCGLVGYYKSICPNCSPIYNSNQKK